MAGIGDIAHIPDFITQVQQVPIDKIKRYKGAGMAQMTFPAYRGATHIHTDMTGGKRRKNFLLPRIRIMYF
jgi:hypothetical protein